jgi:hypothetical protein
MEMTKDNVREIIENYLKELKIRYNIEDSDSKGCFYELFISSTSGFIQVEYNLDDEKDNHVVLQLFSKIDNYGDSFFHQDWDNECEHCDSIEGEIDNLVEHVKKLNQAIVKILTKINQIKDICEEYELDFEEFIQLNYDFDE